MIYDRFPFNNELDILDIRLNILDPYVDYFVLCEAPWTQAGKPKPLYFDQNRANFQKFLSKIIYLTPDRMPGGPNHWIRENYQRDWLSEGLFGASSRDIILVSDADEIWNPAKLDEIRPSGITIFLQDYYRYYLNLRSPDRPYWPIGTRATHFHEMASPQGMRNWGGRFKPILRKQVIFNGGWHFSDLGGPEVVRKKLMNCADQQMDPLGWKRPIAPGTSAGFIYDFSKLDRIKERIAAGKDVKGIEPFIWQPVPIDETFPEYIRVNQKRFAHLIYKEPLC